MATTTANSFYTGGNTFTTTNTVTTTGMSINPYLNPNVITTTSLPPNTIFKLSPLKQMEISFEGTVEELNNLSKILGEKNQDKEIEITKVEILCSRKVLRFTFNDNTTIKTICSDEDQFDFRFAFFIAFAKKLLKNIYTPEGIFKKAEEMQYMKEWVKKVNKAIKLFEKEQKEKELEEQKKKELKDIRKRKVEKKIAKKAKKKQERIDEIAEAIKKGTNPFNNIHIQKNYE